MEKDERDLYIDIIKRQADAISLLIHLYTELKKRSDASIVLAVTQILKENIGTAIKTKVDPLDRNNIKRILGRTAPKNNLNTIIEVAFALGILDNNTYCIANNIKNIRNIFGHDKKIMSLNVEPALSAFTVLHTNPNFIGTYMSVFLQYAAIVDQHINAYLSAQGVTVGTSPNVP